MPYSSGRQWSWVKKWGGSRLYSKLHLTPARLDILVWTIILWLVWVTKADWAEFFPLLKNFNVVISLPFSVGLKASTPINTFASFYSPVVWKLLVSSLFATAGNVTLQLYTFNSPRTGSNIAISDQPEIAELLKTLDELAGIKKIYNCQRQTSALRQQYAADVLQEVARSETLKLLSIAGYENIGKGEGTSLLYETLRKERTLDVEVIILDAEKGSDVINERVSQLRHSNPDYNAEQMKIEISNTVKMIHKLQISRGNDGSVNGYLYNQHPIFRLIICDQCLFLSTYEMNLHGHESPVYRIQRADPLNKDRLSLYGTFLNYYNKIKLASTHLN